MTPSSSAAALGLALSAQSLSRGVDGNTGTRTGTAALIGGAVGFDTGAIVGAVFPIERGKKVKLGIQSTP